MIDAKLLSILACPSCRGDVEYNEEEAVLTCQDCGLVYPVIDSIPVMIVERALNYREKSASSEQ